MDVKVQKYMIKLSYFLFELVFKLSCNSQVPILKLNDFVSEQRFHQYDRLSRGQIQEMSVCCEVTKLSGYTFKLAYLIYGSYIVYFYFCRFLKHNATFIPKDTLSTLCVLVYDLVRTIQ